MPADKLTVRLEATTPVKRHDGITLLEDVTVAKAGDRAQTQNASTDIYSACVYAKPLHERENPNANANITRFGKSSWGCAANPTGWSSHWDETPVDLARFLKSDGTADVIETTTLFPANTGFRFDGFIYGDSSDSFLVLKLWFGNYRLDIYSDGYAEVQRTWWYVDTLNQWDDISSTPEIVALGYLGRNRESILGKKFDLTILPMADGRIIFRRNGLHGFSYSLGDNNYEWKVDPIQVTKGNMPFKVQCPSGNAINFQLMKIQFDTQEDATWLSPPIKLPKVLGADYDITSEPTCAMPSTTSSLSVTYRQGYDPLTFRGDPYDLPLFDIEEDDSYCVLVSITPNALESPIFSGIRVKIQPTPVDWSGDPQSITAYVKTCNIELGDTATDTTVKLTCTVPEPDTWYGLSNRLAELKIGTKTIFKGILASPPVHVVGGYGKQEYEIELVSIAKLLNEPCLAGNARFDGMAHTDVVKWLCLSAGLLEDDLDISTDTTPLPNTVQTGQMANGTGAQESKLEPSIAETPMEWIDKVCEFSGYKFYDDVDDTNGTYKIAYQDPMNAPEITELPSVSPFSEDHVVGEYDRVFAQGYREYTIEPECNELWVVGCDKWGMTIAAVFIDEDSQNPDLAEEDRPANWMGVTRRATMCIGGTATMGLLKRIAYRVGFRITQSVEMIELVCDWSPKLWRRKKFTFLTNSDESLRAQEADYFVEKIDSIEFKDEWADYPSRKAKMTASLATAESSFDPLDRMLLADIMNVLRAGLVKQERSVSSNNTNVPGQDKDLAKVLTCQGGIGRISYVRPGDDVFSGDPEP